MGPKFTVSLSGPGRPIVAYVVALLAGAVIALRSEKLVPMTESGLTAVFRNDAAVALIHGNSQGSAALAGVLESQRWMGLDKRTACFPPPTPEVAFQESDIIFFGKALKSSVDLNIRYRLTEFHVHRSWKGVDGPRIVIGSPLLADGIPFEEGHEYVVYAFHSSLPMPSTDQCSRTTGGTKEEIGVLPHGSIFHDRMIPVVLSQR